MAGTTARAALPYPGATDPDDVPADLQRLAQRLDAVMALRTDPVELVAPNGSRWQLVVGNDGALSTRPVV